MMVGSAMTLGLLPFIDEDRIIWATEICNGSVDAASRSQFQVDRRTYAWLPLVPFVPLNVGWRALRGDEHDYFIRTFPSHLSAELTSVESRSAFVEELIEQYASAPKDASPGSIWSYRYQGREVVYVPPLYCCDLPSRLYDGDGNVLCSPDGGIAGAGDGRCPDFLAERTEGRRVWQDSRPQAE